MLKSSLRRAISRSGGTLRIRLNDRHILYVDAATLAVRKSCTVPGALNDDGQMTDTMELASAVETTEPDVTYGLERQTFCGPAERLRRFRTIDFVPAPIDDAEFLAIGQHALSRRKLTGETLWSRPAPPARTLPVAQGEARLSRDGGRIAVGLLRQVQTRKVESTQTYNVAVEDSIGVWDTANGRLVAKMALPLSADDPAATESAPFALSPDGRLAAAIRNGTLMLWTLE